MDPEFKFEDIRMRRYGIVFLKEKKKDSFFVLTLFIFKAPNYVLARTLTERVV